LPGETGLLHLLFGLQQKIINPKVEKVGKKSYEMVSAYSTFPTWRLKFLAVFWFFGAFKVNAVVLPGEIENIENLFNTRRR
jgi:hypothetical protein